MLTIDRSSFDDIEIPSEYKKIDDDRTSGISFAPQK